MLNRYMARIMGLSLCALAAPLAAQEADLFKSLDSDQDGFIAASEVPEDKQKLFERLLRANDKNGDGKLSREEFAAKEVEGPKVPLAPPTAIGERIEPGEVIKRFDKNGDGKLSKEEAPDRMKENFDRLDGNADGFVELPEFQQSLARFSAGPDSGAIFDRLDTNKDGRMQIDEVPEERRAPFRELLNRLGVEAVDKEQFAKAFAMMRGEGPPPGVGPGSPPGPPGAGNPGFPPGGMGMRGPLMKALDTDSDGELSADEIAAAPKALAQLDKDGDGKITGRELMPSGPGPMGSPPGPGAGPKGPPPSENAGPGNFKEMLGRRLKEADKNNDGKLQKDEVSGPLAGIFEKADRNGDDEVDQAELGAIIESMREKLNNDGAGKVREKLKEKFGK